MEHSRFVNYSKLQRTGLDRSRKMCKVSFSTALFLVCLAQATAKLVILPPQINLSGSEARQQLILENVVDQQFTGQFTNAAEYSTSDRAIARIENGTVLPVGNGTVKITAKSGKSSTTASVTVSGMEKPFDWSFRNHIQPVLAKNGCSSGACHGAAAGQNGFKLSLRGYDDEGDYLALTSGALGCRIVPSDPGRSLMLLKPTGAVPHKGGKKFEVDSLDYRILSQWIAAGTPGPKPKDPRITRIEVFPKRTVLTPGVSQQLTVRAI